MANAVVGHESHAVLDRVIRPDDNNGTRHDFLHLRLFRRSVLQDDFARVIPFGNDAHQLAVGDYEQRSHVPVGHHFYRLVHEGFRAEGPDILSLFFQYHSDRVA